MTVPATQIINTMLTETNTVQEQLAYTMAYFRGDIVPYVKNDQGEFERQPWFEKFLQTAKGEYYIDTKPSGIWSHAEFSDAQTACEFNARVGGRIGRDGAHVISYWGKKVRVKPDTL